MSVFGNLGGLFHMSIKLQVTGQRMDLPFESRRGGIGVARKNRTGMRNLKHRKWQYAGSRKDVQGVCTRNIPSDFQVG